MQDRSRCQTFANLSWWDKKRPKSFDEVVGQDKLVSMLQRLVSAKRAAGRAYWFSGKSGTGKTTLARILAESIAHPDMVEEIDAGTLTPAALKQIESDLLSFGWGSERTGRAIIINEAHGLRKDTIRALLVVLERIPKHVVWAFTTTKDGNDSLFEECDDAAPLLSRCVAMQLTTQGLCKAFAARAMEIAEEVGMGGKPIEEYEKLAKKCGNNMRAILQQVDIGTMI
jgi:replication-associated recombination protein RarA